MYVNRKVLASVLNARDEIIQAWHDEGRDLLALNDKDQLVEAIGKLLEKRVDANP